MRITLKRLGEWIDIPSLKRLEMPDLEAILERLRGMRFEGLGFARTFSRDTCAGLLADHLDAAMELADRILAQEFSAAGEHDEAAPAAGDGWDIGGEAIFVRFAGIRTFVHELKSLELAFTTKISQARVWAERVRRYDPRLESVADLFLSGTHGFVDAGAMQSDTTEIDFHQSDPVLRYLRERGLIEDDVTSLDRIEAVATGPGFRVWGGVPLVDVMNMIDTFLSAADVHYALYKADESDKEAEAETAIEVSESADTAADAAGTDDETAADDDASSDRQASEDDAAYADDLAEPVPVMGQLHDTDEITSPRET